MDNIKRTAEPTVDATEMFAMPTASYWNVPGGIRKIIKLTAEIEARQAYIALFDNLGDAVAFESQVLSIGSNLLPQCAQGVLLGEPPTASYWQWLASQVSK